MKQKTENIISTFIKTASHVLKIAYNGILTHLTSFIKRSYVTPLKVKSDGGSVTSIKYCKLPFSHTLGKYVQLTIEHCEREGGVKWNLNQIRQFNYYYIWHNASNVFGSIDLIDYQFKKQDCLSFSEFLETVINETNTKTF